MLKTLLRELSHLPTVGDNPGFLSYIAAARKAEDNRVATQITSVLFSIENNALTELGFVDQKTNLGRTLTAKILHDVFLQLGMERLASAALNHLTTSAD